MQRKKINNLPLLFYQQNTEKIKINKNIAYLKIYLATIYMQVS